MSTATPDIEELLVRAQRYLPQRKTAIIEEAYRFSASCHQGQARQSGEPYIEHPIQTALYLADLHLDATTLASALLHDVVEDCGVSLDDLESRFGAEVTKLVDGVTKLTRMEPTNGEETPRLPTEDRLKAETLRKMLVAMAEDVRVVLIKLADRLHNMQTLEALSPSRQRAFAHETLHIYSPLAHRLGMWDLKWRLEDISFRNLEPVKYREISQMLAARRQEREAYISQVAQELSAELKKVGLEVRVVGRPKHIYSIHCKSQNYAALGKEISDIYDLYAMRVLVKTQADCYNTLGVIHNMWSPIPGQFDDYIANPKENTYQSLHTTVMCQGGIPLEVQIRTNEMHQLAEYGVAAHWRYKEGRDGDQRFDQKMTWLRQLLEWQREVSGTEEFLESVRTDIFRDQVFVYTPKGDIVELPAGATPIDFAYRIHTELGHRCIGAKVNGRLMSLDYQLQNGDTIEILTTKVARGPSLDWLNPNLEYIHTAGARSSIRLWFRRRKRSTSIQLGRDLLSKENKRLNMRIDEEKVAGMFRFDSAEEFLIALSSGSVTINQVINRLTAQEEKPQAQTALLVPLSSPGSGVSVLGVGDLLTRLGRCCSPIPGDNIVGFVTRTRGVTVHKATCHTFQSGDGRDGLLQVEWGETQNLYLIRLEIQAWDRVGLLRDISTRVSEERVNIASVVTTENLDGTATISLTLHTTGLDQLSRIFAKLEGVRGVLNARRSLNEALSTSST